MVTKRRRRQFSPDLKLKVAVAAIEGEHTLAELSSRFEIQAAQIQQWKRQLLGVGRMVFAPRTRTEDKNGRDPDILHQKIGELTVERDYLKEKLATCGDHRKICCVPSSMG